jgi:putative nucleotidyltransferase with HDIG domain
MALMLSGIRGNDYDLGISMLFAGTLAAYTVRDIQSRTQMFKSIFYIFIGLIIPITAIGLERSSDFSSVMNKILLSLLNAGFAPLITFGLLFILERFSNITTDLKLQEYDNINHPLLVKLSEAAPGTYQHTLALAVLCEKCAAAINANSRLAKVGALFHDIGKIYKPEYFSENQIDIDNKHDLISPFKSAEAIRNHVFEGERLAQEYKLPQRVIDFIPMHHGTSIIKHFYAKALEETGDIVIDTEDYRYHGQKPNSKETAIVMICDSCEALSKVPFKDNDELEKAIEKNIQDKFTDGQLEDSNLTFHDLKIIKDICLKYILAITHQRVEYKEIPEEKSEID